MKMWAEFNSDYGKYVQQTREHDNCLAGHINVLNRRIRHNFSDDGFTYRILVRGVSEYK
jgi:hypothetical protein